MKGELPCCTTHWSSWLWRSSRILGFGGIAGTASWIAEVLFVVFLVMFIVGLVTHVRRRP